MVIKGLYYTAQCLCSFTVSPVLPFSRCSAVWQPSVCSNVLDWRNLQCCHLTLTAQQDSVLCFFILSLGNLSAGSPGNLERTPRAVCVYSGCYRVTIIFKHFLTCQRFCSAGVRLLKPPRIAKTYWPKHSAKWCAFLCLIGCSRKDECACL